MTNLLPHHIDDLKRSGLNEATISAMGCESADSGAIGRKCYGPGRDAASDGYSIPYPGSIAVRYRLSTSAQSDKEKAQRYVTPTGGAHDLYVPPGFSEVAAKSDALIVTEGEKKAAKAVQEGLPCVAVAGVWMWADPAQHKAGSGMRVDTPILPRLAELAKGRRVIVLADSDMLSKTGVEAAMTRLAQAIAHQVYAKSVVVEACPKPAGWKASFGLDDALQHEDMNPAVRAIVDNAQGFPNPGVRARVPYAPNTLEGGYLNYLVPFHQPGSPILPVISKEKATADAVELKATKAPLATLSRTLIVLQRDSDGIYRVSGGDTPAEVVTEIHAITDDRREVTLRLRAEDLVDTERLAKHGVSGSPAEAKELWRYQKAARQAPSSLVCADRGWLNVDGDMHYMYGDQSITPPGAQPVSPDSGNTRTTQSATGASGDAGQWGLAMRELLKSNPAQSAVMGFAASAATLELIGDAEPGMLHIFGDSSKGKTTTLQLAASLIGRATKPSDPRSYIAGWRSTDNGLERPLQARSGAFLPIDELHAAPKRLSMEETAYMITNGLGKSRMTKNGDERERPSWQCQILSTGEISFAERVRQSTRSKEITGGLQFRVIDVYAGDLKLVDHTKGNWQGVFGRAIDSDSALAEALETLVSGSYGHFWTHHIRDLMTDGGERAAIVYDRWRAHFLGDLPDDASAVAQRRTKHAASAMAGLEALCNYLCVSADERAQITNDAALFCSNTLIPAGITRMQGGEGESLIASLNEEIAAQSHRFDRPGVEGKSSGQDGRLGWIDENGDLHLTSAGGFAKLCQSCGIDPERARAAVLESGWSRSRKRWPGTKNPASTLTAPGFFADEKPATGEPTDTPF